VAPADRRVPRQRLSPGQTGLELLEDAAATAAGLFAIIVMFGPVSGGHFNPVVSFADAACGGLSWRDAAAYLPAQVAGGLLLVIFALARSGRARSAPAAVGAYIGAAYWFTSSTSFANPAITIGRSGAPQRVAVRGRVTSPGPAARHLEGSLPCAWS
jgi:arsenate reductase